MNEKNNGIGAAKENSLGEGVIQSEECNQYEESEGRDQSIEFPRR